MPAWKIALGELISECLAVFIIIVIGCSAACMYTLYDPSPYQTAYWGVCITWGLSVTIAIYVTGAVSGTHANPAVTLALALYRGFSWRKVLPYSAAQVVGGFLGAAVVYLLYGPVIDHFNDLHHLTRAEGGAAGVFFTHPGLAISVMHAFVDEIVLTAILVLGIFAVTEEFNTVAPQANSSALIIGLVGGRDRGQRRLSGGLGDQSGARSGSAPVCLDGGLGRGGLAVARQLLVGADRGPPDRRRGRRRSLPGPDPPVPAGLAQAPALTGLFPPAETEWRACPSFACPARPRLLSPFRHFAKESLPCRCPRVFWPSRWAASSRRPPSR